MATPRALWSSAPTLAAGLALAALVACGDSGEMPYEHLGSSEQALISDQLHQSGTTGFFFLPPLVPRPGPFGDFVVDAAPAVRVERVAPATGQVLGTIATFTRTSGPGGETVRLHPRNAPGDDGDLDPEGYFVARFRTAQFNLSPDATYRVTVSVANRTLGFADLEVGRNLRELANVNRDHFVPVLNGQVLRIKFRIDRPAVDQDADGVFDWSDNCPTTQNPNQEDSARNGVGDACRCEAVSCAPLDACHLAGSCNPATGLCSSPLAPEGTSCDDGDACTSADSCSGGVCAGHGGECCGGHCCDTSELSGRGAFPGMAGELSLEFPPLSALGLSRLASVPDPSRYAIYLAMRSALSAGHVRVERTQLWGVTIQYGPGTTYEQLLPRLNAWLADNVLPPGVPGPATLDVAADGALAPTFVFAEIPLAPCHELQSHVIVPPGGTEPPLAEEL